MHSGYDGDDDDANVEDVNDGKIIKALSNRILPATEINAILHLIFKYVDLSLFYCCCFRVM